MMKAGRERLFAFIRRSAEQANLSEEEAEKLAEEAVASVRSADLLEKKSLVDFMRHSAEQAGLSDEQAMALALEVQQEVRANKTQQG